LIDKASDDPALQGKMFRMLWASEVFTFMPDHPEMRGEFALKNGAGRAGAFLSITRLKCSRFCGRPAK
jgi:hypothetical protein